KAVIEYAQRSDNFFRINKNKSALNNPTNNRGSTDIKGFWKNTFVIEGCTYERVILSNPQEAPIIVPVLGPNKIAASITVICTMVISIAPSGIYPNTGTNV